MGLGTWQLDGNTAEQTTLLAIKLGYRHIGTVAWG